MSGVGVTRIGSLFDILRNVAYDTVFHVGDTGQQFLWDLAVGSENSRSDTYHSRQMNRAARTGETPLTRDEQQTFQKVLKRNENEKITDYWKRRKALLNYPEKKKLVADYQLLEKQQIRAERTKDTQKRQAEKRKIKTQFRAITNLKHASNHAQGQKP